MQYISRMTVTEIKTYAKSINVDIPSKLKKAEMVAYLVGMMAERQQGAVLLSTGKRLVHYSSVNVIRIPSGELGVNDSEWKARLLTHGVTSVKIPNFDPAVYKRQFWDWIQSCNTGIVEDRPETWSLKGLPHTIRGMFKSFIGHQPFIWDIREKCYPIFASIWGTNDLLCSFDGGTLSLPNSDNKDVWESWFHFDQGRFSTDLCSIQGAVYLTDVNPGDPGFTFIEDSHKLFKNHLDAYPSQGYTWQTFDPANHAILNKQRIIMPVVKAGEILLWDSRLAHSTLPGYSNNYRMVSYVCMMPKFNAKREELIKRVEYYTNNRMTGHWCYGPFFAPTEKEPYKRGEQYNFPPPYTPPPIQYLTPLRKMLIGVDPTIVPQYM